jgi:hypothetical protein
MNHAENTQGIRLAADKQTKGAGRVLKNSINYY